jgi:hypothetical protein
MAKKNRARKQKQQSPDATAEGTPAVAAREPRQARDKQVGSTVAAARSRTRDEVIAPAGSPATQHNAAGDTLWLRVLWFCIGLGVVCRFAGLNWDNAQHLHPDERFLTMIVPEMRLPQSVGMYFDTSRSLLNPQNLPNVGLFVYGQLPLFLVKSAATLLGRDNYDDVLVWDGPCRHCSIVLAFCCCGASAQTRQSSTRCFRRGPAGSGAASYSAVALFLSVDTFATTFLLAAFLWCLRGMETPDKSGLSGALPWLIAGAFWGAALASKNFEFIFRAAAGFAAVLCDASTQRAGTSCAIKHRVTTPAVTSCCKRRRFIVGCIYRVFASRIRWRLPSRRGLPHWPVCWTCARPRNARKTSRSGNR